MKCLGDGTRVPIVSSVKRTILSAARRPATRIPISKRLFGSSGLAIGIALAMLLAGVTLSPSMHLLTHGGSVNAADESISTFDNTNCTTPKSSWNLDGTACAVATNAPSDRRIAWVAPDGNTAQVSNSSSGDLGGTFSDSYHIPTGTDPFAQVGTWTVQTIDASGTANTSAQFVVHDPANFNADLAIAKYGPSQNSADANINYRIELINHGPDDAQAVTLTDSVPANTTFVSGAQTSGPAFTTPTLGGGAITCSIDTLPVNAIAIFSFTFNVTAGTADGTVITNVVSISSTTNDAQLPGASRHHRQLRHDGL